jgi:DNA-binding NarL/FixJ family response regulator
VTALAAVEAFLGAGAATGPIEQETVRGAFAAVRSPGRLERVRTSPTVLVDAAHNPAGVAATVDAVRGMVECGAPHQHVCLNAAKVVEMDGRDDLTRAIAGCDLISVDGQAVVWASRLLGQPVPERVAGIDLMLELLALAERRGLSEHWATTLARVVHARALEQRGLIADAADEIARGVELSERGVATVEIAYARLAQAEAHQARGDPDAAAEAARHARDVIERCAAPGILRELLARTERRLHRGSRVRVADAATAVDQLTDRELSVLRLLPGELSQREIGEALFVSLNTVKSHARSIYRKLNVATRDEAVARARTLGLL